MTPTELDAIFRAWRDQVFADLPEGCHYANTREGFVEDIWPYTEDPYTDTARLILARGLRYGFIDRALPGLRIEILISREDKKPLFSFADPPPLAAGDLKIVEVPDGIKWQIEEYDGWEHVAEAHQTWS